MDKDILTEAISEMRGDMRKRVGKKLLTIEVIADGEEEKKKDKKEEDKEE